MSVEGGCLCGQLRFAVEGEPASSIVCHCASCRKASGAPSVAWVTFERNKLQLLSGHPNVFHSSAGVRRSFCGSCGTALFYENDREPDSVDITSVSLDDPHSWPPAREVWLEQRLRWQPTNRQIDQYPRNGSDGPDERTGSSLKTDGQVRRPPFIVSTDQVPEFAHAYPHSSERMGPIRRIGKMAGLERVGVSLQRLPPGSRSSWPHAEESEEEFVYLIQGEVDCWINGNLHPMGAGDLAAFPAGTGIAHCFINESDREALLLVGGEAEKEHNRIHYPVDPSRRSDVGAASWWDDVPEQVMGPHDGKPSALR